MTDRTQGAVGALKGRGGLICSQHGASRRQQRCIPPFVLDALTDYGEERFLGNGCRSFSFSRRSWRHFSGYMGPAIEAFAKYRNVYVVVAEDGSVITVAWRH